MIEPASRKITVAALEIMRAFTATLGAETNAFSPVPTGWEAFQTAMLWRPGAHPHAATEATGPLIACRERVAEGWQVIEGTCAFAWPGGPVRRDVYEALRDEIVEQARKAAPVDIIALGLHGAMTAYGYEDCEGDLLEHLRAVSPSAAIGAVFDLHAHLSERMTAAADLLIGFKHYPHVDYLDRSRELVGLLARIRSGDILPTSALRSCGMLIGFRTTVAPWRGVVRRLQQIERRPGVLNATIVQGFALGDNEDMGTKVLVTTNNDQRLAEQIAAEIDADLQTHRDRALGRPDDLPLALRQARASKAFPVVLADPSDNPGGGAPGDNMRIARALIEAGMVPACIGPVWDPLAVRFCTEAGLGARFALRVGGKVGPSSGPPLDLHGEVVGLRSNATQRIGEFDAPLGDCAAFRADGLTIVLSSLRDQAYHPDLFETLGVRLADQRFIAVKSAQQFRLGFESIAGRIISVPAERRDLRYTKRPRPLWPFERDASAPNAVKEH